MTLTKNTQILRAVREQVDHQRILDTLLRGLMAKRQITESEMELVLGITIKKVAEALYAQAITIFTVNQETGGIKFQNIYYSKSLYGDDEAKKMLFDLKAEQLQGIELPSGHGIVGKVIETGETRFIADVYSDPDFGGEVDRDTGFVTRSMITVPLKLTDGKVIGAIQVINKEIDGQIYQFAEEDVFILEDVAEYSAGIVQKVCYPDTPFTGREMANYVARLAKVDYIEVNEKFTPNVPLMEKVTEDVIRRYSILPLEALDEEMTRIRAAMPNPLDHQRIGDFELVTSMKIIEQVACAESDIIDLLPKVFKPKDDMDKVMENIAEEYREEDIESLAVDTGADEESAPIISLANRLVEEAYDLGTSDIHIEPQENDVLIRYRIDGACRKMKTIPRGAHRALVSRYKIMADLKIAERRLPQDGRIIFKKWTKQKDRYDLDLRVSTAPMANGEKICMRILDKTKSALPLDKLGFSDYNIKRYREAIHSPYGMILHCGPTGSGKSMTLFSALGEINNPEVNISTAEDPIEYTLAGINQMQMHSQIGLNFAVALRCFLRQDPDIILVGETRDHETAEIAVEAALTGHLLFSTLHTNDAPSTISRLTEMGIEAFMIASALRTVCAQRLIRKVDMKYAVMEEPTDFEKKFLELADRPGVEGIKPIGEIPRIQKNKLPPGHNGYKGRTGVHEILIPNDDLRTLIAKNPPAEEIRKVAKESAGMVDMFADCMGKVRNGATTLEHAFSTIPPDDVELKEKGLRII